MALGVMGGAMGALGTGVVTEALGHRWPWWLMVALGMLVAQGWVWGLR